MQARKRVRIRISRRSGAPRREAPLLLRVDREGARRQRSDFILWCIGVMREREKGKREREEEQTERERERD
jgi:hypothetical protein